MAVRLHQRNVINAISIENTSIGEYFVGDDGDQFREFLADATPPTVPTRTNVNDDEVGDGRAYPKQGQPYYYDPLNKPFSAALNTTIGARIYRMWLGGAITETANAPAGTIDSAIRMLTPGAEPLCCNLIRSHSVGGAKFLYGDCFVQTIEIAQTGAGQPRITATFSNGGHHIELADTTIDQVDIEDPDAKLKFDGKRTKLTLSDGVDSYDFFAEKRQIDVTFTGNQNVDIEQMPGDEPVDPLFECEGGYTKNLNINVQDANIRARIYMNTDFHTKEFTSWKKNRKLTSVTLVFSSCEVIGLTTHHAELEIKFPVAEFTLEPDANNDKDTLVWNIRAIDGDPVTGSLVLGRIRQVGSFDETVA